MAKDTKYLVMDVDGTVATGETLTKALDSLLDNGCNGSLEEFKYFELRPIKAEISEIK